MRAAVLHQVGEPLVIEQVSVDNPGPREVLVQTAAAGVCHSDLHFMNGSYATALPSIKGHEAAGVVEKVGADVTYLKPGDHVISCMSMFCGGCAYCLTGKPYTCENTQVLLRDQSQAPRISLNGQAVKTGLQSGVICRADAFA